MVGGGGEASLQSILLLSSLSRMLLDDFLFQFLGGYLHRVKELSISLSH